MPNLFRVLGSVDLFRVFADKMHIAPRLSLVNIAGLNKVLRSEIFVSEDRQMWAVHLILDFKPLLDKFQEVGHAIRASDLWLAWIDVSMPGFLAQEDLSPVELPLHHALLEAAASREETISSRLSFDEEIDQFQLEEEKEEKGAPIIPILDAEDKFDRFLGDRKSVV